MGKYQFMQAETDVLSMFLLWHFLYCNQTLCYDVDNNLFTACKQTLWLIFASSIFIACKQILWQNFASSIFIGLYKDQPGCKAGKN
jgi:hypothetical protein